ncbi:hypothetical protein D3C74_127130 [compost metagenome]
MNHNMFFGDSSAARRNAGASRSYQFLHHVVEERSRLACPEIINDEKKETAAVFWEQARGYSRR